MSDYDNRYDPYRSINVTRPQQSQQQQQSQQSHQPYQPQPSHSSIDASRVSAYTAREQQALERLKKKVGNLDQKENRQNTIKTIVAIILVLILIVIAIVFVIVITKKDDPLSEGSEMRLSMQIENKSALSIITETGQEELRRINPGDTVALRASVRNAFDITGDFAEVGVNPPPIYVRFKLVLILDYKERYDILVPTMTSEWCRYNKEIEDALKGVQSDDYYYYFRGSLTFMESRELFSEILFDGNSIFCEDGGKYGQIQVHVEAVEANIGNIVSRSIWSTAPQQWINEMVDIWTGDQ